jgi:hypothetical protein
MLDLVNHKYATVASNPFYLEAFYSSASAITVDFLLILISSKGYMT